MTITNQDENNDRPHYEPASECVRRFLTHLEFKEDEIGASWHEMCRYVRARLRMTPFGADPLTANTDQDHA